MNCFGQWNIVSTANYVHAYHVHKNYIAYLKPRLLQCPYSVISGNTINTQYIYKS